jgi:hypothetical protein
MAKFAVVRNGIVDNTIIAEDKETAESIVGLECIEFNDENPAYIGWLWDGNLFVNPNLEEVEETATE